MAVKRNKPEDIQPQLPEVTDAVNASEASDVVKAEGKDKAYVEVSFGKYTMREPRAKDILFLKSFMQGAPAEYQTEEMFSFYLIYKCGVDHNFKDFDAFLDALSLADMSKLGELLLFFRDSLVTDKL